MEVGSDRDALAAITLCAAAAEYSADNGESKSDEEHSCAQVTGEVRKEKDRDSGVEQDGEDAT